MKLSLNRTQLKIIALISMVIDHAAWGFLDFHSPLAQFLHVCGRLTIPIMCFFVAEGFRKTRDHRRYMRRMLTYAVASIIPFYVFFHEEYGYRQNIMFDYTLGIVFLITLEAKVLKKYQKVLISILLFATSMIIGGWVVMPMIFIAIFYYGHDFKHKASLFIVSDVVLVLFLTVAIYLNSIYSFANIDWVWWDKFYLLGFVLALPLLKAYNGEKGPDIGGRYFFYVFYPVHFLILHIIKFLFVTKIDAHAIYVMIHVVAFLAVIIMTGLTFRARSSKGQMAISFFLTAASIYLFGFVLEIVSSTPEAYYVVCCVEYFGEYMAFIAALYFISYMCRQSIPVWVMALHIVIATILMYLLFTTRQTGFFYEYIGVNNDGPFPRIELEYSTGFMLSMAFMVMISIEIIIMCAFALLRGSKMDKKRIRFIIYSAILCWFPFVSKSLGLTGGYEIPGIGLLIVGVFLYLTFIRFGTLDSVVLAGENALDHGHEGIIVLDSAYRIQYHNSMVDKVLGDYPHNKDARKWPIMKRIVDGELTEMELGERFYNFEIEPLIEHGYEQGKMIWIIDSTEHHAAMKKIENYANRDGLTGIYNRTYFKKCVDEKVCDGHGGAFLMMDMDDFKQVNDLYGHQRGDAVLKNLANILIGYSEERLLACRVGGDEFCAYLIDETDKEKVAKVIADIMEMFNKTFRDDDSTKCSVSVGAIINDLSTGEALTCSKMYSLADKKLYEAKNAGKNTFII